MEESYQCFPKYGRKLVMFYVPTIPLFKGLNDITNQMEMLWYMLWTTARLTIISGWFCLFLLCSCCRFAHISYGGWPFDSHPDNLQRTTSASWRHLDKNKERPYWPAKSHHHLNMYMENKWESLGAPQGILLHLVLCHAICNLSCRISDPGIESMDRMDHKDKSMKDKNFW